MSDAVKWILVAVAVYFGLKWLQNGVQGNASFQAQASPSGWGSGMLYAPGSAWQQAYGMYPVQPVAYAFGGQVPIYAGYSRDNGFQFQYGN